jgi:ATP synthase protein I
MASDEREKAGGTAPPSNGDGENSEVSRRRDQLLADARRKVGGTSTDGGPDASALMGLGLQFVVAILACLYAGMWLDRKLGTAPWMLVLGVFVGAGAGFYAMYRVILSEDARSRRSGGKKGS